ncbi:MAG: hypothetical protein GX069_07805 [Tissierellia bacterium]|nr:hypothetical protein [Tissierellia bacterium]
MIRYKQLITLKVMDKYLKNPIGRIKDVLYSSDYRRIDYIVINNGYLLKNKVIIDYKSLSFQENNKIIYNNTDIFNFKMDKYVENTNEGYKLIDKEIRNEYGECIGFVKDVVIDKDEGKVEGFIITEGIIEDLLKGRNYIPLLDTIYINEDCISIPSSILI